MSDAFEFQRRVADSAAPGAHSELMAGGDRIRKVRKLVAALPRGSSILDVGCSDGTILSPFSKDLQVHGVDGSQALVDVAATKGVHAVVGNVEALPFPNDSFDAVFAGEIIEHLLSPDRFLVECNRVLKMNGTGIFTIPNIRTPVGIAMMLYGIPPMYAARYRSSHIRDFTAKLARQALENNGFKIIHFGGSSFMIPPLGTRLSWLADIFPTWADNFIIQARKVRDAAYSPEYDYEQSR
jgi:ubiquinone/menaquinone biosynthesis C-methylase UbiE